MGRWVILRFLTEIAVYLGNGTRYEIGPCLLWNVNRKVIGGGSIRVGSDDLE